jgi:hypothetical protein
VNSLTRGLAIVVFGVGLLGATGCSEDNETEAQKLAKTAGDPGAPKPSEIKGGGAELPTPTSSDEAFKRSSDPGNLPAGYPGMNKKKAAPDAKKP